MRQECEAGRSHDAARTNRRRAVLTGAVALTLMFSAAGGLTGYWYYQNAKNHVTVSFETNGGSAVRSVTLEKGTAMTEIPCTSKENSSFSGWYYDEQLTRPYSSQDAFEANTKLYASYGDGVDQDQIHESQSAYLQDCDAAAPVVIHADTEITQENLGDYLTVHSDLGALPDAFLVDPLGDGNYRITPGQDYEAGCVYDFSTVNGATIVTEDSASLTSLSQRIHKDESEVVELQDTVVYLDWDTVIRDGSDYKLYIPKSDAYTLSADTAFCLLDGYAEWVDAGSDQDSFGQLFDGSTLFLTAVSVQDDLADRILDDRTLEGGAWYYVEARDGELEDILEAVDVYTDMEVSAKELLDTKELEQSISQSAGAGQLADLLTCAVMDNERFLQLAGEAPAEDDLSFFSGMTASAADEYVKNPLMFRNGLSMGNARNIDVPANRNGISVSVSWSRNSAQNPNFPGVDASDPDNNQWSALRVIIGFQREIKGVAVQASVDVSEYLKVTMQGYKEWDGSKIKFDYAANMYSQTNFDFYVKIRSDGADSWEDISASVNDNMSSADMLTKYQKMINADGGYLELCDVELIGKDFYVIPEFPIFTVHLGLNYVLKFDLSAGLSSNFTYLDATQVGMRGKTGEGLQSYTNELVGANRYAYNLDACGYLGVKTGLKGELTLSFTGLRKLGEVGISLELGAYMDLYGYLHLEISKPYQYSSKVNKSFSGGYYMEMGIYLEVRLLARSQVFDAEAGLSLFDEKWPLFTLGNRYVVYSVQESGNNEYFMHANSADILDISGLSTTCLDLKTGELTDNVSVRNIGQFVPHISDDAFQYQDMKLFIDGKNAKQKARTATIDLYCSIPVLSMSAKNAVDGYICITIQLYWADPSLNVSSIEDFKKTPKASYCLKFPDGSVREVAVKQIQFGEPVGLFGLNMGLENLYQLEDELYTTDQDAVAKLSDNDQDLREFYITEDTVFYRNAEKKQFYVSFVYYDNEEKCWKGDMRLAAAGEEPVPPERALNTPVLTGWEGHDNVTGLDLTELTKLSDDQHAYESYRRSTLGQDQNQSLQVYKGSTQWQVSNDIADYFNTETSKPNPELTFTQTYVAQYRDCNVTFVYGTEEERQACAVTVPFDTEATSPDNSYFVDSAGKLLGWDYNGDGAVDTQLDAYGKPILPRITTDGMIFYGVYEQPYVTIHLQEYDIQQGCYVDSATFQAQNDQDLAFAGKTVLLDGEPVILEGETVDCFTKAADAVGEADGAVFIGWQKCYRYAGAWYMVNETENLEHYFQDYYLRPIYKLQLELTFLPVEGTVFTSVDETDDTKLNSHSVTLYEGEIYAWWDDLRYNVWSANADEVSQFVGWDCNGDGEVDYAYGQVIIPNRSMTLQAVFKTEKCRITTRIQSPVQLSFPAEITSCITKDPSADTHVYTFTGTYTEYQALEAFLNGLPQSTEFVEEETGYRACYYASVSEKSSYSYYPDGKSVSVPVYTNVDIKQAHFGHTVTFSAGENGYFNQNDGSTVTEFTMELDNGTYDLSDFIGMYSTSPRRNSVGTTEYVVDYWMDEAGNPVDSTFIVSKQGRTLTAHWTSLTSVNLKSGDIKYGNYYVGSNPLINPRMRLSEGTHKFSELLEPTQSFFPNYYRYEVTGWKDSRDTEDVIHGLDEEFTITAGECPTFTAQWEQTGAAVRFMADVAFQSGTGSALAPGHDFNQDQTIMLPLGTYKVSDLPVTENLITEALNWRCVGWRDEKGTVYKFADPDAVIVLDGAYLVLSPEWEGTEATVSFDANGGVLPDGRNYVTQKYPIGDYNAADLPIPTRENTEYESFTFAGWRVEDTHDDSVFTISSGDVFHMADRFYVATAIWDATELKHDNSYGYDETQHWSICENEGCTDPIGEKEPHTFGEDGICTTCGYGCKTPPLRNGVYEISNLAELFGFAKLVNEGETGADAILTGDITINRALLDQNGSPARQNLISWTPIGISGAYTGTFDGQGHTISGVYATTNGTNGSNAYLGLFCEIQNATIRNLTLTDSYFKADCTYLAGIVGHATDSQIICVENRAALIGRQVAGICVQADNCQILNCSNMGMITSTSRAAGIAAYVTGEGTTANCYHGGAMRITEARLLHAIAGNAVNCYYNTTVTGIFSYNDEEGQTGKDREQVQSGEVAYLLSQGENGAVWGQTIGEDDHPLLGGAVVYQNGSVYANGAAKLEGTSLSLDGTVGVHFYVSLSDAVTADAGAYMEVQLPNESSQQILVSDAQIRQRDGKDYHVFTCGVAAKEMTQQIHARIVKSDGTLMGAYAYSVQDYADYILDDANGFDQKTKDLASAMLNYGIFAQAYFKGENPAQTAEMEAVTGEALAGYTRTEDGTLPKGIRYYGSSLLLESGTVLRHYFLVEPGTDIQAYSFDGSKGNYYYLDLAVIPGSGPVTCTLGGYTLSYDPMCYVRAALTSPDAAENLKKTVAALYLYWQAAEAYLQA